MKPWVAIPLAGGGFALVDADDEERVACHRWRVEAGVAVARIAGRVVRLSLYITGAPPRTQVRSLNGSKLDCRRENLHVAGSPITIDRLLDALTVQTSRGCREWTAARSEGGYGVFNAGPDFPKTAHRLAYHLVHGPVPKGMQVCHRCDNPPCISPDHLFLGTPLENTQDCVRKGRARRASGEAAALSKLTDEAVAEILESNESAAALAKRFGITRANIWYIKQRRTWRHVRPDIGPPASKASLPYRSGRSKLSDVDVRAIFDSTESYAVLAERYGVVVSTIHFIKKGLSWRHLTVEQAA